MEGLLLADGLSKTRESLTTKTMVKSQEEKAKEIESKAAAKAKKAEEEASRKNAEKEAEEAKEDTKKEADGGITVKDPQVLRPKELPLVVTKKGGWDNEAQAEFAKTLNAYAYRNPTKWAIKKEDQTIGGKTIPGLISKLEEIGRDPSAITKYRGVRASVSFKNRLIEN